MRLNKLTLKNIRSYKEEEIEFPAGSILLSGDIGSGKSSILLAIEYALFGLQPGQKGSHLLRHDSDSGEVILDLDINGKNLIIERRLKRNKNSITNEYSAVTIDGKKEESSLTEIKTKILEEMGYPFEFVKKNNILYRYTVYTPQEQMKQIILEDPESRLNVLRHVLGIDKYKRIRENLTILLNYIKEECKVMYGEIKDVDEHISKLEFKDLELKEIERKKLKKFTELQDKIRERQNIELELIRLEDKIKQKDSIQKEIDKTKIMVAAKYESLSSLNVEIAELKNSLSATNSKFKEDEYINILSKIKNTSEILDLLNSKYTEFLSRLNSLDSMREESLRRKDRIFKIDLCPTCLQDVPDVHKHNILNDINSKLSEFNREEISLKAKLKEILKIIQDEKDKKSEMEDIKSHLEILKTKNEYLDKNNERLQSIIKNKEFIEKDITLLDRHVIDFKVQILELTKFDNLAKLKQKELKKTLDEEKNIEINLAQYRTESELIKREIVDLERNLKEKEIIRLKLKETTDLQEWLSGVFLELVGFTERNILLRIRHEFSNFFTKWFEALVQQNGMFVKLDESFTPIVVQNDTEVDYSALSGGERTAVALAYRFALNQTVNTVFGKIKTKDIVMLDEPTDGFSETQLEKMRSIFEDLKLSQLIIVSHEQKIESFVDKVIKISKEGEYSKIYNDFKENFVENGK